MTDSFDLGDPAAPPAAPPESLSAALLAGLNEGQLAAVEAIDGPLLVLAGAGTGKTRVLTTRLAHILGQGKAHPGELLAVTFTNKAAQEMRDRVGRLLQRPVEGWWVGTFHALGARMLRINADHVGLTSNFTILDTDDQIRLIKQLNESHRIDPKALAPRAVAGLIQRWKDRGLTPDKVTAQEGAADHDGKVLALYKDYQQRLQTLNAADFGDLLLLCLSLFRDHPEIAQEYQSRFRYILVDEYQDTNVAQYLWLRMLAMGHQNICCVGDDDQSIYSWRGAEVENILRFERDFPGAKVVRLERNYRSTPHILAAASGLIAHNEGRLGKTLWTDMNDGDKVRVMGVWDGEAEARSVGAEIDHLHGTGHKLGEMAILVRAGFQTREFEERLITMGIPYRIIGGPRFYERLEIRDAIAYLRVLVQPDDDLAFERIVNLPPRGIGKATLRTIHLFARARHISLTRAVAELLDTDEIRARARTSLVKLMHDFERWRGLLASLDHPVVAQQMLDESGYLQHWKMKQEPDAPGRVENLGELVAALAEFEDLGGFLEHVSLVMENDAAPDDDKVNLMTLHGAKGLEFETVFLPGWEEGLFPHERALDEGGVAGLEEERRLAYVGLTRAGRRAIVSHAASRRMYGSWKSTAPSRFIAELPEENVNRMSEIGAIDSDSENSVWPRRTARPGRQFGSGDATWKIDGREAPETAFDTGERVFHQKFGYGRIVAMDGDKFEIEFEKAGTKKVMASFIEAT